MSFIILSILSVGSMLVWLRNRAARRGLALLLAALLIVALILESARGALLPIMLWAGLALAATLPAPVPSTRLRRLLLAIPVTIAGGLAALSSAVVALDAPPPMSGRYGVGSFQWALRDEARAERRTQDPGDRRELLVEIWYPAEAPPRNDAEKARWDAASAEHRSAYTDRAIARSFAENYGIPGLPALFAHELTRIEKPGGRGIPVAPGQDRYPVLLFSPGYGVHIDFYAGLLADIASHGYVVVAVNPSYETGVTLMPDGRILRRNEQVLQGDTGLMRAQSFRMEEIAQQAFPMMQQLMAMREPARRQQYFALRRMRAGGERFLDQAIDDRVADLGFVLDQLEKQQGDGPANLLTGRIDLSRIGAFGMSLGGPASGQFCLVDQRCKAGLNYDGEIWGGQLSAMDTRIPYMWITGEYPGEDKGYILGVEYLFRSSTAPVDHVELSHMGHMDFSDLAFLTPVLGRLMQGGDLMLRRENPVLAGRRASIDYSIGFFDHWLKGRRGIRLAARAGVVHRRRNQRELFSPPARER